MSINVNDKNLGHATAYAYYKAGGGTMTEAEFTEFMADFGTASQTAVEAAQAALASETAAQTAATTATNKASEATTAATTATTKAGEASTSASTATSAKDTAVSAASTATTKATEATTAAATATSAATTATTAKDDAVSAKTAAQTAQTGAETAAASVSASAEQIATNAEDISQLKSDLSQKANQDGYYADLVSGGSTQLLSDMVATDTTPYNYRTAGGSLEIGDREKLKKIVGGSLAVNQLINIPDGTTTAYGVTFSTSNGVVTYSGTVADNAPNYLEIFSANDTSCIVAGHKYVILVNDTNKPTSAARYAFCVVNNPYIECPAISSDLTSRMYAPTAQAAYIICRLATSDKKGQTISGKASFNLIDLTAMFGTTIADYVYSLETATAGAGVAWLKAHFPKIFDSGYIPYNAGTLEHVSGLSEHKMTGFNQWDEEWESGSYSNNSGAKVSDTNCFRNKNTIPVIPGATYYFRNLSNFICRFYFYDASGSYISALSVNANSTFVIPDNAYFINFKSDRVSTYTEGSICINLHWDGERDGEYEPYEEHSYSLDSDVTLRGIPKLDANNNIYYDGDEYLADGTVNRKLIVHHISGDSIVSGVEESEGTKLWRLNITGFTYGANNQYKKGVVSNLYEMVTSYMAAYDTDKILAFNSSLGAQIIIHDSSVSSVDELKQKLNSTPIDVLYPLATPTTESADPYTEIQNVSNWGTEEFVTTSLVPVGHETAYQPDLRAKIEVAPESPDTDGLYLMKRENGQNSYVAYLGELPSDPTTDGTYTLKCTVSGGTVTKTWEADE